MGLLHKKIEALVLYGRRADHKQSPPSYEEAQRSPEYQVTEDERCVKVFPHLLSVQLLLLNTLFLPVWQKQGHIGWTGVKFNCIPVRGSGFYNKIILRR